MKVGNGRNPSVKVVAYQIHLQDHDYPVACNNIPFGDPSLCLLYKTEEMEKGKDKKQKQKQKK